MLPTKEIHQGDVCWLDFAFSSGSAPTDRHSFVVIESDAFNRTRIATTVDCLITSTLDHAAASGNGALKKHDAHLPKPSVVNASHIVTVDKSDLTERIGWLPPAPLTSVLQGLQLIFEPPGPAPCEIRH